MLHTSHQQGYIALMSTIIISMVLLVMISQEAFAGWHARFNILGTESKEQANTLAEGCIDLVKAGLIVDPASYNTAATLTAPSGTCNTSVDTSKENLAIINAQAVVNNSYVNEGVALQMHDIYIDQIPLVAHGAMTPPPNLTISKGVVPELGSWWETAHSPP